METDMFCRKKFALRFPNLSKMLFCLLLGSLETNFYFLDANAITYEEFKIQLTEQQSFNNIVDLCRNGDFRDVASSIFRKYWAMHLMKLRNKKKSEILRWDNLRYAETILNIIPTELARAIFNINSSHFRYNILDDKILTYKGCNPSTYTQSNWNYIVLINVINRVINNNVKEIIEARIGKRIEEIKDELNKKIAYNDTSNTSNIIWPDDVYKDKTGKYVRVTKHDAVINKTVDDIINTYGHKYESNILKAKNDVLYYFKELDLGDMLDSMRKARYKIINIDKFIDINKDELLNRDNKKINLDEISAAQKKAESNIKDSCLSDELEKIMKDNYRISSFMDMLPKLQVKVETLCTNETGKYREQLKSVLFSVTFSSFDNKYCDNKYSVIKYLEYAHKPYTYKNNICCIDGDFYELYNSISNRRRPKDSSFMGTLMNVYIHIIKEELYVTPHKFNSGNYYVDIIANGIIEDYKDKFYGCGRHETRENVITDVKAIVANHMTNDQYLKEHAPVSLYIYLIQLASQLGNDKTIINKLSDIENRLKMIINWDGHKQPKWNTLFEKLQPILDRELHQNVIK